jgi:hypothetical protein
VRCHHLKYRLPEYYRRLFETETLGLIFGDPGCGKSFFAVDIALSVASGTSFPWAQRQTRFWSSSLLVKVSSRVVLRHVSKARGVQR